MRKLYIIGLLLFVATAYFSEGFYHEDEHFQLLEFARYKTGDIPASELPWEYGEKMRPTFQVSVVYVVFKLTDLMGISDPFIVTTVLRLMVALLSFIALYMFTKHYKSELTNQSAINWFVTLSLFLWYVPFLSVRFSSEALAAIFLIFSIVQFKNIELRKNPSLSYYLVGLLLGLSFISRYQMGFIVFGFFMWILLINKQSIKNISLTVVGFLFSFGFGIICDYWFYGEWLLSAYNYFYQNLIENKAANYGTSPFWFYSLDTVLFVFPLFGVIVVPCFIYFFIKYPKHIFTWLLVPFILIHHLIGHKEMRFLFPLFPFLPFIIVSVLQNIKWIKYFRFIKYPFWALNLIFLILMSFKPAYDNVGVFKYLYRKSEAMPVYFISHQTPFRMYLPEIAKQPFRQGVDLNMEYYYKKGFYPHAMVNINALDSALNANPQKSLLVARTISYEQTLGNEMNLKNIKHRVVYQTYHSHFRNFNYFNWMSIEDVGVWTIVEVEK